MEKDLTLDDLKNAIEEMGYYVSEIRPKGPCWVIFGKVFYEGKLRFEKTAIECRTHKVKNIDQFKFDIITDYKDIWEENNINPIFSLYTLEKIQDEQSGESLYAVRYAITDHLYKGAKEITIEEAKEILKTRRDDVSMEFYQDLKNIYEL